MFITTKLWNHDQGYGSAFRAFDGCLRRLGLGSYGFTQRNKLLPDPAARTRVRFGGSGRRPDLIIALPANQR